MAEPIVGAVAAPVEHREAESLEFPGCRPVRITRDEMDDCEDRSNTGTAALECRDEEHFLQLLAARRS